MFQSISEILEASDLEIAEQYVGPGLDHPLDIANRCRQLVGVMLKDDPEGIDKDSPADDVIFHAICASQRATIMAVARLLGIEDTDEFEGVVEDLMEPLYHGYSLLDIEPIGYQALIDEMRTPEQQEADEIRMREILGRISDD